MVRVSGESCHSTRQLLKMSFSALGSNTLEPGLESIRFGSDVLNFLTRMYQSIAIYGQILDTKINTENSNRIIGRSFRSINHNAKVENSFDKNQVCLASDPIHPGFLIFSETNRDKLSALKRDQRDHLKSFPRENALIVNDGPIESELWLDRFISLIRFADLGNGSDSKLCGESKMFSNRIVNRLMDLNLVGTMHSKYSLCYLITSLVKPLHCFAEHLMLLRGGIELYHQGLKHSIEDSLQGIYTFGMQQKYSWSVPNSSRPPEVSGSPWCFPMKILLLSSPVVQLDFDRIARLPNLGLASLAAHVDDLCTVHVADIHGLKGYREYVKKIVQGYDLVGLTAMSFQYQEALALARIAKEAGAQTVFGGYHPTLAAEEIGQSDDSQLIDYIVRGEGEATFRELTESLLAGREFKGISGLSYHDPGSYRMIHNPARPLLDVSDIKMPNRDARLISKGFYSFDVPIDSVETSRGCTQGCKFCSINLMYGRHFRTFPIERVVEDIRDAEEHGAGSIFFPDDNITLNPKRLERLCQAIIDAGLTHLRYKTQASASGIASSKRLVDKMGEAGFDGVFLGVESINKRNLEFLGKGKMSNDAEIAVQYLHDNNIIVSTGLIGGNPDDDEEDLWENFHLARRLKVDFPIFYISTPYPKTEMRAELEEMGLVTRNDFNKYDGMHANLRTKHLSDEEVQYITWEMNARYYGLDWIRYNKVKKIYPKWFAGEIKRLVPFYAKRKLDLTTGRRTPRDFFQEDLEKGELCKGVV